MKTTDVKELPLTSRFPDCVHLALSSGSQVHAPAALTSSKFSISGAADASRQLVVKNDH